MKYIIIGLGNYGHVLSEELSAMGHEIIGEDISERRVSLPVLLMPYIKRCLKLLIWNEF